MRVLALVPHPLGTSPGQRFRIEQWEPHLRTLGIEIVYSPFSSARLSEILYQRGHLIEKASELAACYRLQAARATEAGSYDLVYVFREAALIGPAWIESRTARLGIPLVFDFDDAVFVPYKSPSNGYLSYLKFPGKTAKLCSWARRVMAGNDYLASYASRYNDEVTVVPTTIDTDIYRPELRRSTSHLVTIGWTGSHSTAQHLRTVVPALSKLARRQRFRLVVVGAEAPTLPGAEVLARPWCSESEVHDLGDIDIGIMPLPDDVWSRGKCGLKALQFMALGIPTVVSPVGVNTRIVSDGVDGFLARADEEWIDRLAILLAEPRLRRQLGGRAREKVVSGYAARTAARQVEELLRGARGKEPPSSAADVSSASFLRRL